MYFLIICFMLVVLLLFFLMIRLPPISTLFPYTTLFRSLKVDKDRLKYYISDAFKLPGRKLPDPFGPRPGRIDRKSTRLNSSHANISYAVFCLKKKKNPLRNTKTHPHLCTGNHVTKTSFD